jgi:CDP-diglyceride synthetase
MKVAYLIGTTFVVILITLYEWPKMNRNQKKDKQAFVLLTIASWLLAVLLIFSPDIAGPNHLIETVFKPLGKFLEK